MYKTVKEIL